jgi:hypothetical protein
VYLERACSRMGRGVGRDEEGVNKGADCGLPGL